MMPLNARYPPRLAWAWAVWVWAAGVGRAQFSPQCEEIKIPMCRGMPYNRTRLPNLLHHSTQENARLAIEQFELLMWTKCSAQLEFYLCSLYAPICTIGFASEAIPPCRSVCQEVRAGCEPLLARFHIPWPLSLACDALPVYDRGVCITPQAIISAAATPQPTTQPAPCECAPTRPLRKKIFMDKGFHYVLRGRVRSVDTFGELTLTTVLVREVVMGGRVGVAGGRPAHLYTNRSCACPALPLHTDYLLLGWEDYPNNRLLYLEGSIAVPYRRKYGRKIKEWQASLPSSTTSPPLVDSAAGGNRRPERRRGSRRRKRKRHRNQHGGIMSGNRRRRNRRRRRKGEHRRDREENTSSLRRRNIKSSRPGGVFPNCSTKASEPWVLLFAVATRRRTQDRSLQPPELLTAGPHHAPCAGLINHTTREPVSAE